MVINIITYQRILRLYSILIGYEYQTTSRSIYRPCRPCMGLIQAFLMSYHTLKGLRERIAFGIYLLFIVCHHDIC